MSLFIFSKFHFVKGFIKNLFNPHISKFAFVSDNNSIHSSVSIYRNAKVKLSTIDAYTYIGNDTDVECSDIGKFCSIADHCRIGMSGHKLNMLSTSPIFTEVINGTKVQWVDKDTHAAEEQRTVIGNDVWIGSHVLIKGGITVGNGAVIGAGAVVVKDIPPYAIVGGVPAKIIRYRFNEEMIAKLEDCKWWNLREEYLIEIINLFHIENPTISDINKYIPSKK